MSEGKGIWIVFGVVGMAITLVVWGIIAPQSPQDVAEGRGLTQGFLGATNNDGSMIVVFDNESLGRKYLTIYPSDTEDISFVEDDRNYVSLFFEKDGVCGCEKLTDEQLVDEHLQKLEIHYK